MWKKGINIWHDGHTEMPQGENVECLVMVGTKEDKTACWEVLKWDDREKAFVWWDDEFKQNCLYPAENFMLWADLNDLIDIKELNEWLAKSDNVEIGKYELRKFSELSKVSSIY